MKNVTRLDWKVVAVSLGLLWGLLMMLLVGLGNLMTGGRYGGEFLAMMASLYPGYDAGRSLGQVLLGTVEGLVDGAIAGAVFAWIYNCVAAWMAPADPPA